MFDFLKAKAPPPPPVRIEPTISNAIEYSDVQSSDSVKMGEIFGAVRTDSGAIVNPQTAMRVTSVAAAVRLLTGAVATTPCSIFRINGAGDREKANDHPYWWLFNRQPTPMFTAATFWEFITAQVLLRGDSIAYLVWLA